MQVFKKGDRVLIDSPDKLFDGKTGTIEVEDLAYPLVLLDDKDLREAAKFQLGTETVPFFRRDLDLIQSVN